MHILVLSNKIGHALHRALTGGSCEHALSLFLFIFGCRLHAKMNERKKTRHKKNSKEGKSSLMRVTDKRSNQPSTGPGAKKGPSLQDTSQSFISHTSLFSSCISLFLTEKEKKTPMRMIFFPFLLLPLDGTTMRLSVNSLLSLSSLSPLSLYVCSICCALMRKSFSFCYYRMFLYAYKQ
jgi:hypothetical protein